MYKTLLLMVLLFSLSGHAWAANFSDPIDGVFRNIYGDSITIGVPSLVSKSPAYDDQSGELTFQVNPDTAYTNFSQLTDLKQGDPVRVEYKDNSSKDNQLIATGITKLGATPVNASEVVTTPSSTVRTVTTTTTSINP